MFVRTFSAVAVASLLTATVAPAASPAPVKPVVARYHAVDLFPILTRDWQNLQQKWIHLQDRHRQLLERQDDLADPETLNDLDLCRSRMIEVNSQAEAAHWLLRQTIVLEFHDVPMDADLLEVIRINLARYRGILGNQLTIRRAGASQVRIYLADGRDVTDQFQACKTE